MARQRVHIQSHTHTHTRTHTHTHTHTHFAPRSISVFPGIDLAKDVVYPPRLDNEGAEQESEPQCRYPDGGLQA